MLMIVHGWHAEDIAGGWPEDAEENEAVDPCFTLELLVSLGETFLVANWAIDTWAIFFHHG